MRFIYWFTCILIISKARTYGRTCIYSSFHLRCKHHLPNLEYPKPDITILELHNLEWKVLDFNNIKEKFPNLKNLTVLRGTISKLVAPLKNDSLEILQLKLLKIRTFDENFFENFTNLKYLSLHGNWIEELPQNISFGTINDLHLSDNRWNCVKNLTWALNLQSIIKDADKMLCRGSMYPGKPLIQIAKYLKTLSDECPLDCSCSLPHVVQNLNSSHLEPVIEVNCSNKKFTELPKEIPTKTMILRLENNDISNLGPLKSNPIYRTVIDLYLDNNSVTSIEELEGSHWFTHFRVLSLSGNKLTELPSYALDNALLHNKNAYAVQLSLGGNPWRCDCVFTPVFQELLQKYAPNIRDIRDVKCSYVEGDENSLLPILDLSRSSVCRYPSEYSVQEALNLLNAVLASLIIFILGKLAYDYYHFKKTGRLPWIVTKIP